MSPGRYSEATWTGISTVVEGIDNRSISNQWLAENIQQSHGPLGASYPDVAWGVEGDTPFPPADPEWIERSRAS